MLILEFYPQFVTHSLCCDVQGLHEEEARARQSERERANRAEKKLSNRQRQMSLFHQDSAVPDIIDDEQVFRFLSFPFLYAQLLQAWISLQVRLHCCRLVSVSAAFNGAICVLCTFSCALHISQDLLLAFILVQLSVYLQALLQCHGLHHMSHCLSQPFLVYII